MTPGDMLLSRPAIASAALIVWNDLWLKRQHPGVVSGKLSDVGLCILMPLVMAALIEWGAALIAWARGRAMDRADGTRSPWVPCAIAAAYFTAVKAWPVATNAHVASLSWLFPGRHFGAVTDPTDLVCLPLVAVAWWLLGRRAAPSDAGKALASGV